MSTIGREQVIIILRNNGVYPGDPQVRKVYSYNNAFNGGVSFKLVYDHAPDLEASDFVINPELLWSREAGLTGAGGNILEVE